MLRVALALFAVQAGFHGLTATLPLALARAGVPDPQIGLIVGTAALVQIPAAFVVGALIDRYGGRRLFAVAGGSYMFGTAILALPVADPGGPDWPFLAARAFQGIGLAAALPSVLSLVPRLIRPERRGFGLAFMGSAHNLTLTVLPPVSLVVLDSTSIHGVAVLVAGLVVAGLAISSGVKLGPIPAVEAGEAAILASVVGLGLAAVVAIFDRGLRTSGQGIGLSA